MACKPSRSLQAIPSRSRGRQRSDFGREATLGTKPRGSRCIRTRGCVAVPCAAVKRMRSGWRGLGW
ncbi:hypothetical protein ACFPRL_11560 [Pseudoclavibacter helvolus]